MATVTLAESAKLTQNDLVAGVIENVITVDRFYDLLPFQAIDGNALAYNRENALAPVATAGVGSTDGVIGPNASSGDNLAERQAAKNAATFTTVTSSLTTIIGDTEVNGLIQATRSNYTDQTATQLASKAKSCGRKFQDMLVNGDGTDFQITGLLNLAPAGQQATTGDNGSNLSFSLMDEMMDLVVDKDGQVDYFMMHSRTIRSFMELLRGLGGASINDVIKLPSGREVPAYRGVPIFRNDYLPITQTKGSGTACSTIFAGTFDDGSESYGIAGLTAKDASGMQVVDVGEHFERDEHVWRVKWYCGLALFSEKGISWANGILN